jgi:hypothetical protein
MKNAGKFECYKNIADFNNRKIIILSQIIIKNPITVAELRALAASYHNFIDFIFK